MSQDQVKYLQASDDGLHYTLVVRDVDHARQILRDHGALFSGNGMSELSIDDAEARGWITWSELTREQAAQLRTHGDDDVKPLSERVLGDWYCSEW